MSLLVLLFLIRQIDFGLRTYEGIMVTLTDKDEDIRVPLTAAFGDLEGICNKGYMDLSLLAAACVSDERLDELVVTYMKCGVSCKGLSVPQSILRDAAVPSYIRHRIEDKITKCEA